MQPSKGRARLITKEYAVFFTVLGLIVTATVIFNAVTDSWGKRLVSSAEALADEVGGELTNAADIFSYCVNLFSLYTSGPDINSGGTANAFAEIFGQCGLNSGAASGYFYHINYSGLSGYIADGGTKIYNLNTVSRYEYPKDGKPVWQIAFNSVSGEYSIVYLTPYFADGEYSGYLGLELDSGYIASKLTSEFEGQPATLTLVTSNGYIIISGEIEAGTKIDWNQRYSDYAAELLGSSGVTRLATIDGVYAAAHVPLSTGHILIYETPQSDVISQNLMLIFFFLLAVVCILLLSARDSGGVLLIDVLCNRIFGETVMSKTSETRARVSLLLNLSIIIMLLYRLICLVFIGTGVFAVILMVFTIFGMLYVFIGFKHYIKYNWITIFSLIIGPPLVSGIMLFVSGTSGTVSFVEGAWTLAALISPLFLFKKNFNRLVLPLFSVMLFTVLFVLAVFFDISLDYGTYAYFSNLFFVGFTLFASAAIFAGLSESNYSEMSQTLEKLRNAQSSLVQHEKMVTLGKLIAGVAHEINTPIGAIKASAETLESSIEESLSDVFMAGKHLGHESFLNYIRLLRLASDSIKEMRSTTEIRKSRPQMRKFLEEINLPNRHEIQQLLERMEICDIEKVENNIDLFASPDIIPVAALTIKTLPMISSIQTSLMATTRVSKIVFALKTYAHSNQSGERSQINLQSTIETVLMLYHNQIKQSVKIVQSYEDGLPKILANADELSQIWTNLIQNALHAMQYSGTLTITAKRLNSNVAVSIGDTGGGISPELLERIFEPFYTTKPLGEGSGLGLDICRRIVRGHNGDLSVESTPGKGSVFTVTLPIGG